MFSGCSPRTTRSLQQLKLILTAFNEEILFLICSSNQYLSTFSRPFQVDPILTKKKTTERLDESYREDLAFFLHLILSFFNRGFISLSLFSIPFLCPMRDTISHVQADRIPFVVVQLRSFTSPCVGQLNSSASHPCIKDNSF